MRADGDWCFPCGGFHNEDASEYRVPGIGHVIESDGTLLELHDLPNEWEAQRQAKVRIGFALRWENRRHGEVSSTIRELRT